MHRSFILLVALAGAWSIAGLTFGQGGHVHSGQATLRVIVPEGATLKVGDFVSKQTGRERILTVPDLMSGYTYWYVCEATWTEGGKAKKATKDAKFKVGETISLDLTKADATKPEVRGDNIPPEGFKALFNGKDLTGWQGLIPINKRAKMSKEELDKAQKDANDKILPHWTVKDGVIHYDGKGNNLQTAKDYGDFELYLDWKIGVKGDSGLYLRGNPQVQIWDNKEGSGGLYNNKKNKRAPLVFADNPVGQWNTFHIVMKGDKVTIKLNGKLVVDDTPLENYWNANEPLPSTGPIELQHHGDPLWFKNIYIKKL